MSQPSVAIVCLGVDPRHRTSVVVGGCTNSNSANSTNSNSTNSNSTNSNSANSTNSTSRTGLVTCNE